MNLPHDLVDILEILYPVHVFRLERTRPHSLYPSLGVMTKLFVILDGTETCVSTVYDNGYTKQFSIVSPYRKCETLEETKQYLHETITKIGESLNGTMPVKRKI